MADSTRIAYLFYSIKTTDRLPRSGSTFSILTITRSPGLRVPLTPLHFAVAPIPEMTGE
jgi:hypothetical protein